MRLYLFVFIVVLLTGCDNLTSKKKTGPLYRAKKLIGDPMTIEASEGRFSSKRNPPKASLSFHIKKVKFAKNKKGVKVIRWAFDVTLISGDNKVLGMVQILYKNSKGKTIHDDWFTLNWYYDKESDWLSGVRSFEIPVSKFKKVSLVEIRTRTHSDRYQEYSLLVRSIDLNK